MIDPENDGLLTGKKQSQDAIDGMGGGMGGNMGGNMGGGMGGGMGNLLQQMLMSNPDLMNDPEVMQAMQDPTLMQKMQ